jgi:hypothetical protein
LGHALAYVREQTMRGDYLARKIEDVLNQNVRPSFVGDIHVKRVSLGQEYPIFYDACIRASKTHDGLVSYTFILYTLYSWILVCGYFF